MHSNSGCGPLVAGESCNHARAKAGIINSLSCSSSRFCIAVGDSGYGGDQAFAEIWNGTIWSIQRIARVAGATDLSSVSCTSRSACIAVGARFDSALTNETPLIERWDGASWSVERVPGTHGAVLQAVSCASHVVCTALGTGPGKVVAVQSRRRWRKRIQGDLVDRGGGSSGCDGDDDGLARYRAGFGPGMERG